MSTVSMTGNDVIKINNRILADLADDNVAELTFPTEIAAVKTGKNGNSIFALNESGRQADFKLRVIRGSADDKFLNGLLVSQQQNFSGFVQLVGELVKQVGNGAGLVIQDTYLMSAGVFTKQIEAKSNVAGDTEQSICIYEMKFANAPRVLA